MCVIWVFWSTLDSLANNPIFTVAIALNYNEIRSSRHSQYTIARRYMKIRIIGFLQQSCT